MKLIKNILAFLFLAACIAATAQESTTSELYKTLKKNDSILFDAAFNKCGIETLNSLFTEDFEFYHDRGGLTEGKAEFIGRIAADCANRNFDLPQPAKRILVDGSLEVYPMYNKGKLYAAIQHGVHRFESLNEQNEYQKGDIAKFTHLWILEDDTWKIKREISYDHRLQQ
ncbi:nuclear transport factor 2 family protein [uncultured Croceitalea sp.]|uniref:nuclear transport factor 2 family protein n=1 Tax=uncultured Croceitalea sp. TaxID=1798908 RepID=UPI0033068FA4